MMANVISMLLFFFYVDVFQVPVKQLLCNFWFCRKKEYTKSSTRQNTYKLQNRSQQASQNFRKSENLKTGEDQSNYDHYINAHMRSETAKDTASHVYEYTNKNTVSSSTATYVTLQPIESNVYEQVKWMDRSASFRNVSFAECHYWLTALAINSLYYGYYEKLIHCSLCLAFCRF